MKSLICPHCNQEHPAGARFCQVTGQAIPEQLTCANCGHSLQPGWIVCPKCGEKLEGEDAVRIINPEGKLPAKPKRRWQVGLLLLGVVLLVGVVILVSLNLWEDWPVNLIRISASSNVSSPQPVVEVQERQTEEWVEPTGSQTQIITGTSTSFYTQTPSETETPLSLLPTAGKGSITFVAYVNGTWQVFIVNPDGSGLQQLTHLPEPGAGNPAISPDGSIIAFVHDRKNIYTISSDGNELTLIYQDDVEAGWPEWSPDSRKIVFSARRDGILNLFTMNFDGSELKQITESAFDDVAPTFSPDGSRIAFSSNRTGKWEVHILDLRSGKVEQITNLGDSGGMGWPAWSPDGSLIAFESIGEANSRDIYVVRPDGTQLKNITNNPAYNGAPAWSPDSREIAFVSDRDDGLNIYIVQSDGTRIKRLSNLWGWGPSWSMVEAPEFTLTVDQYSTLADLEDLFSPFWQAWQIVHDQFVDQPVDQEAMMRGAIRGMLEALDDRHTSYMDPEQYQEANIILEGHYDGIGAWVDVTGDYLVIISPMPGSPAEEAGLKPGDEIVGIDGRDMTGIDGELARRQVLGPAGSIVTLTIRREGLPEPFNVEIRHAQIVIPNVESEMLAGDIGYVKLYYFGDTSSRDLRQALQDLLRDSPKGLIFDLRNNTGGFLNVAIEVGSEFISEGVLMYEVFGDGSRQTFSANRRGIATDIPLVVLINEGTASASEIIAGAIQDYERGLLVGTPSFGKGSVQNQIPLADDQGAVRVTIARWLTPEERTIQDVGLTPDYLVEITEEDIEADRDPQLDKALALLSE
jgi:carboxyl-terminal processing protease